MRTLVLAIVLASAAPAAAADEPAPQVQRDPKAPARADEDRALRPSGFWGSTQRSKGGAYRYRLLAIGIVLAIGTGIVMRRLVKRANAERAARATRSPGA
jgi:hypothetical protein